ncbi:MAG TPA: ABC transporter permease [Candidatus Sumerlaeota bacterium]|nr:ABC transporter permease [Candidatus Sumerlaeota bacterium]HPS00206.1 ABC transporter permease [Candidatus Sumerlaeota bacterium]
MTDSGGGDNPKGLHCGFALRVLAISLRTYWRQHATVAGVLALGVFSLALAWTVGFGLRQSVNRHVNELFPPERLVLRPKALSLLWLQVETAKVTPAVLEKVRAIEGVARVSPEATLQFPVSAEANLFGSTICTDIAVTGVEKWILGTDAPKDFEYDPDSKKPIPAVISSYFLDLYNMSLAESNGMPKLSTSAVVGRNFRLILGNSVVSSQIPATGAGGDGTHFVPCQVAALSYNPQLLSLMIPLDAVERFNREFGIQEPTYRALHVELTSPEVYDSFLKVLPELGLEPSNTQTTWRKAALVLGLAGVGFSAFGVLVFGLVAAFVFSTLNWMLTRRVREIALFRALGASSAQVGSLLLIEIAFSAGLGALVGGLGALGTLLGLERWYQGLRVSWTFLPETLVGQPGFHLALLVVACWGAATLMALKPVLLRSRESIPVILNREG